MRLSAGGSRVHCGGSCRLSAYLWMWGVRYQAASHWSLICVCGFPLSHVHSALKHLVGCKIRGGFGCCFWAAFKVNSERWLLDLKQTRVKHDVSFLTVRSGCNGVTIGKKKKGHKRIQQMQQSNVFLFFFYWWVTLPCSWEFLTKSCSSLSDFNNRISGKPWQRIQQTVKNIKVKNERTRCDNLLMITADRHDRIYGAQSC